MSNMKQLVAMPLMMLSSRMEWNEDRVMILRAVFVTAISACLGACLYLRRKIDEGKNGERGQISVYFPPEVKPSLMPAATTEIADADREKRTYYEHESTRIDKLRQQVLTGALISFAIHFYFEINPPLIMQAFMLPFSIFEDALFTIYFRGNDDHAWNEKTEDEMGSIAQVIDKKKSAELKDNKTDNKNKKAAKPVVASKEAQEAEMEAAVLKVWDDGTNAKYDSLISVAKRTKLINHSTKETGYTALMVACGNRKSDTATDAVKTLLKMGSDVLSSDSDGWTAAHWCCYHANVHALTAVADAAKSKGKLAELLKQAAKDGVLPLAMAKDEAAQTGADGDLVVAKLEELVASI